MTAQTIPLSGFAPDATPTTPGIITDCLGLVPTEAGLAGCPGPSPRLAGVPAAKGQKLFLGEDTAGVDTLFAGFDGGLYKWSPGIYPAPGSWLSIHPTGGAFSSATYWSVGQFGNAFLAANGVDQPVAYNSGTPAFVAAAPKAKILVCQRNFVMALGTNEATYGAQGDRWWCSAINDYTTWTPSITTQATTGRLVGGGGDLTAGAVLGEQIVAYKRRAMFLGSYAGSPEVWQWQRVPGDIGCIGPDAVCSIGTAHFFVGESGLWMFDGFRPQPLGVGVVREWFFKNSHQAYRQRVQCVYEPDQSRVWVFFASTASTTGDFDRALVYCIPTQSWGVAHFPLFQQFDTAGVWVNPDVAGGTQEFVALGTLPQYVITGGGPATPTRAMVALTGKHPGGGTTVSLTTGLIGDDDITTRVRRVTLRGIVPWESTCAGTSWFDAYTNSALQTATSSSLGSGNAPGHWDVRLSGRWHQFTFGITQGSGTVEVNSITIDADPAGTR